MQSFEIKRVITTSRELEKNKVFLVTLRPDIRAFSVEPDKTV